VIRNKAPRTGNPLLRSIETAMLDHQARFRRAAPAIRLRSTRDGRLSRGERDGSSSCDAFRHQSIRSRMRAGEKTSRLSRSLLLKPVSRERKRHRAPIRASIRLSLFLPIHLSTTRISFFELSTFIEDTRNCPSDSTTGARFKKKLF